MFRVNNGDWSLTGLPNPDENVTGWEEPEDIRVADNYAQEFHNRFENLNDDQRQIFETVREFIHNAELCDKMVFVDGPGGGGKTFLFEVI